MSLECHGRLRTDTQRLGLRVVGMFGKVSACQVKGQGPAILHCSESGSKLVTKLRT